VRVFERRFAILRSKKMAVYFHPAKMLDNKESGIRLLSGEGYESLVRQLSDSESLFGKYSNQIRDTCPKLDSEEEYNIFENKYNRGGYSQRSFYAVPQDSPHFDKP
jgi:hypothetical protein